MANVFDKAKKGVSMRTASAELMKVDIMKRLLESGMLVTDKFPPENDGGLGQM